MSHNMNLIFIIVKNKERRERLRTILCNSAYEACTAREENDFFMMIMKLVGNNNNNNRQNGSILFLFIDLLDGVQSCRNLKKAI
jgi:hypothetical protein